MYGLGNPVDAAYTLGSYIKSVHVKDGLPPVTPGELGKETEFMEGFVDFPRVFSILKQNGFAGPYIIEREISDAASEIQIAQTLQSIKKMVL
jgi:sugar phosphate isomerase/epimerase